MASFILSGAPTQLNRHKITNWHQQLRVRLKFWNRFVVLWRHYRFTLKPSTKLVYILMVVSDKYHFLVLCLETDSLSLCYKNLFIAPLILGRTAYFPFPRRAVGKFLSVTGKHTLSISKTSSLVFQAAYGQNHFPSQVNVLFEEECYLVCVRITEWT